MSNDPTKKSLYIIALSSACTVFIYLKLNSLFPLGTLRMMVASHFYFDSVFALGLNDEVRMAADDGEAGKN